MPRVAFLDDGLEVEVSPGTWLYEAAERAGARLPFGCLSGMCATCIIEVEAGEDSLSPADLDERLTREAHGVDGPRRRLACQCRVQGDVGVRIVPRNRRKPSAL